MRESIWNQSGTRPRILWSAAILVSIGFSVVLLACEWFAAFDSCVANPTCAAPATVSTLEGYFAVMIGGVGIAVAGVTIGLLGVVRSRRAIAFGPP